MRASASITTTVTNDIGQRDCLTVAAIVFKTAVLDTDNDGLLDEWETATTPLPDPNGKPLPLLSAMGAKPNHKDAFIEVGYMDTYGLTGAQPQGLYYGGEFRVAHSHRPSQKS